MIFLSHTHSDKKIVNQIAHTLAQVFGQEQVFYDSWSIQPGDGIIDKMSTALENCKFFFFFVSKKSLQSNMVKLEWQNALFKSTREKISIIPVKVDNSMMPAIFAQTLYIDIFGQGTESAVRQMIDVISGNNTYRFEPGFHNIRAYVAQEELKLIIEFRAEVYMEPHSNYLILLDNLKEDLNYRAVDEGMFDSGFQEKLILTNGLTTNVVIIGRSTATSPGFPFIVEITSKNDTKLNFNGAMRAVSRGNYELLPVINIG